MKLFGSSFSYALMRCVVPNEVPARSLAFYPASGPRRLGVAIGRTPPRGFMRSSGLRRLGVAIGRAPPRGFGRSSGPHRLVSLSGAHPRVD